MNAREITAALGGRWANGQGIARCPTHKDRSPSLAIKDGKHGNVLLHCFAGCTFAELADELKRLGLIEDRPRRPQPRWSKAARKEMQRVAEIERADKAELRNLTRTIRADMILDGSLPEEVNRFLSRSQEWKSRSRCHE